MLQHSRQLISNLKDIRSSLEEVKKDLELDEYANDNKALASIFQTTKAKLLDALAWMDKIAQIDPKSLQRSRQKVDLVQRKADLVQRNLFEARKAFVKIQEHDMHSFSDTTNEQANKVYANFLALINIYQEQMHDHHHSFQRLNRVEPRVALHVEGQRFFADDRLEQISKEGVLSGLQAFVLDRNQAITRKSMQDYAELLMQRTSLFIGNLVSIPQFQSDSVAKELRDYYKELFLSLSEDLVNEADLVYKDFEELNQEAMKPGMDFKQEFFLYGLFDSDDKPYLISFMNKFGDLFEGKEKAIYPQRILEALKDQNKYKELVTKLFQFAQEDNSIDLVAFARQVLVLNLLQLKAKNSYSSGLELDEERAIPSLRQEYRARELDEIDPYSTEAMGLFSSIQARFRTYMDYCNASTAIARESAKRNLTHNLTAVEKIADIDTQIIAEELKTEFEKGFIRHALTNPESATVKFINKYKHILDRAGITETSFQLLGSKIHSLMNNSALSLIFNKIADATQRFSHIDPKEAATLIYKLESFAKVAEIGQQGPLEHFTQLSKLNDLKNKPS